MFKLLNLLSFYFTSITTIFKNCSRSITTIYNLIFNNCNYYYFIIRNLFTLKNLFKLFLFSCLMYILLSIITNFIIFVQTHTLFEILIINLNNIFWVFKTIIGFFCKHILSYVLYYGIIATVISLYLAWLWLIILGRFSNIDFIFKLQGYSIIGITILLLVSLLTGTYMILSICFNFYLHEVIINNLLIFYSNINILMHNINIYLESLGINWLSGFSNINGSNLESSSFIFSEYFFINSSPDVPADANSSLPTVGAVSSSNANVDSSSNITINPNTHVASITNSENTVTLAVTVNTDSLSTGIKDAGQSLVNAAKEVIQNPGPSLTTGVGLSAGAKAGIEVAKSIQSPVGKVAAIAATTIMTTGIGIAAVNVAKGFAEDQVINSAFNKPTADDKAPSPTNDSSTMFSPLDSNEGWTWTITFATDGTTSPLQYFFHALILFQVIMLLIFVYLSVLVIMQIIVNKHSDSFITFINRLPLPAWLNRFFIKYFNMQFDLHRNIYRFIIIFNILLFLFCSIFSILIIGQLDNNLDYYCTNHLSYPSIDSTKPK